MAIWAIAQYSSPYIKAQPFYPDNPVDEQYGVQYTNPSSLPPSKCHDVEFSFHNDNIAVFADTTPFLMAYPFSYGGGWGVKYTDAVGAIGRNVVKYGCDFLGNSDVAISCGYTPFMQVFPFANGVGYGTIYTNPDTLPEHSYGVSFGGETEVGMGGGGYGAYHPNVYPFSPGIGYGSKYSVGGISESTNITWSTAFTPQNTDVVCAGYTNPIAYPFESGVGIGTKYTLVESGVGSNDVCKDMEFSNDGLSLAVAIDYFLGIYHHYAVVWDFEPDVGWGAEGIIDAFYWVDTTDHGYGIAFYGNEAVGLHGTGACQAKIWKYSHSTGFIYKLTGNEMSGVGYGCSFSHLSGGESSDACPMPPLRRVIPYIPVEVWDRYTGRVD